CRKLPLLSLLRAQTVRYRSDRRQLDDGTCLDAAAHAIRSHGLDSSNTGGRQQVSGRQDNAGDESSTANRSDYEIRLCTLLLQLAHDRALTGHYERIVERMNVGLPLLGGYPPGVRVGFIPRFAVHNGFCAEPLDGINFELRRSDRQKDGGRSTTYLA